MQQMHMIDPIVLVKTFKFERQKNNETMIFKYGFDKIPYKSFYSKHKKCFDRLAEVCRKYSINPIAYIEYCVSENKVYEPKNLLKIENFMGYANSIKIKEQHRKIYEYYMKSVNYIADECILNKIKPIDFIKRLITENKLAYEYMCGNISMYYIASINNIEKICEHLNQNSKDELSIIFDIKTKLNQDVQETFIKFKNTRAFPLRMVEDAINQKLNKKLNKKQN